VPVFPLTSAPLDQFVGNVPGVSPEPFGREDPLDGFGFGPPPLPPPPSSPPPSLFFCVPHLFGICNAKGILKLRSLERFFVSYVRSHWTSQTWRLEQFGLIPISIKPCLIYQSEVYVMGTLNMNPLPIYFLSLFISFDFEPEFNSQLPSFAFSDARAISLGSIFIRPLDKIFNWLA
jgi:hypothetical protein